MPSINRIEMPLQGMSVAEISGQWGKYFNFGSYEQFRYLQHDICKGLFEGEDGRTCKFDLIIADQVWSIWIDLILLQKNVPKMIKRGFYFYISSPFFIRFQAAPQDNSRWPARGLKTLLLECVFDESEIGISQWGNRAAALRNFEAEGPPELDIENDDLSNDPDFPITA